MSAGVQMCLQESVGPKLPWAVYSGILAADSLMTSSVLARPQAEVKTFDRPESPDLNVYCIRNRRLGCKVSGLKDWI